jgi:D-alanyl-D-alanine carboxypeptidase
MTRKTVITVLLSLYLVGFAGYGYWAGNLWVATRPVAAEAASQQGEVLGISTGETATPEPTPEATSTPALYPVLLADVKKPVINSRRYLLYHVESGKVLLEKDADLAVPIASTTKLMTAFLVSEIGTLPEKVTASKEAASMTGSLMGLRTGEIITTEALLYGLMLNSGNDAAHALAEHYGKQLLGNQNVPFLEAVDRFVAEMNTYAGKLNLSKTLYKDPAGLNDDGKSSALDLAKLSAVTNQRELLRKITTTAQITVTGSLARDKHELRNSNRLVADYFYEGVISGKTGYTEGAGHCLVASVTRNGTTLVAVVLSTYQESKEASALENRKLLDWGFASFRFE